MKVKLHPNDPSETSSRAESRNQIMTSLAELLLFDHLITTPSEKRYDVLFIDQLYFVLEQYLHVYVYQCLWISKIIYFQSSYDNFNDSHFVC